jgi:hypothetical protein
VYISLAVLSDVDPTNCPIYVWTAYVPMELPFPGVLILYLK